MRWRSSRLVIVAARFNETISQALVAGAQRQLRRAGVPANHLRVIWVPGAFELPVAAARIARSRPRPDALIAVGALIRGETSQYQVIAQAVAGGLTAVSVQTGVPVGFGVIVAETLAQARARAGRGVNNRGAEAAQAALEMIVVARES